MSNLGKKLLNIAPRGFKYARYVIQVLRLCMCFIGPDFIRRSWFIAQE